MAVMLAAICLWFFRDTDPRNNFITDLKNEHLASGGKSPQVLYYNNIMHSSCE